MSFEDEEDLLSQLRSKVAGLIITDQGKRAVFLPRVWEDIPLPKLFLGRLKLKAGLTANHWSDSFQAHRFTCLSIAPSGPQSVTVK